MVRHKEFSLLGWDGYCPEDKPTSLWVSAGPLKGLSNSQRRNLPLSFFARTLFNELSRLLLLRLPLRPACFLGCRDSALISFHRYILLLSVLSSNFLIPYHPIEHKLTRCVHHLAAKRPHRLSDTSS